MIKPNLFIVGAAKAGTTTLYSYLEKHSSVFMPEDELYKEPAYFSKKGESMGLSKYISIFKNANKDHQYVGESSNAYLLDATSAKRIYKYNPESKIIIILRNPVNRAYSLYNWMVQEGYEYANSFEKALALEEKRKKKIIPNSFEPEYYWNYMYFNSGLYYAQVMRYIETFPSKNIKIIIFEDMINDMELAYKEISIFLNTKYEKIAVEKENESRQVYFPLLSFIARKINNYINKFIFLFNSGFRSKQKRDFLVYKVQKKTKTKKMNNKVEKKLQQLYQEDIKKLEKILKKNLKEWKSI